MLCHLSIFKSVTVDLPVHHTVMVGYPTLHLDLSIFHCKSQVTEFGLVSVA